MALYDEIRRDINSGRIPRVFGTNDLLRRPSNDERYIVGEKTYAKVTLQADIYNKSISTDGLVRGNHVGRVSPALYYRHGNGAFSLIEPTGLVDNIDCRADLEGEGEALFVHCSEEAANDDPSEEVTRALDQDYDLDPVRIIAHTIFENDYQKYFRRQRRWYPQPAASGWQARLNSYFWPTFQGTWGNTQVVLDRFVARFREIETSHHVDASGAGDALVLLFEEICGWGGVKLPESNPEVLREEVFRTLEALDNNEEPTSRLNSAWTKLYAIARPQCFVIYDSRVATALVSILDPYMTELSSSQHSHKVKGLGTVVGRGGSRPRTNSWAWPVGYQQWPAQICANRLCIEIVDYLNNTPAINDQRQWNLREVEAVLFMEGY